jgi:hypothetical protein
MHSPVFRSRWIALAFVLLTAMGAALLVGDEEGGGVIGQATERLIGQRTDSAQEVEILVPEPVGELRMPAQQQLAIPVEDDPIADQADEGYDPEADSDTEPAIDPDPDAEQPAEFVIVE